MAVLVEAISVVVRRDAIEASFPGGWQGFMATVPNRTLCMDDWLARVGFMNPIDVGGFLSTLAKGKLMALDPEGFFVDLVVIDQRTGPTAPCRWVNVLRVPFETGNIRVARLSGDTEKTISFPRGWTFQGSLSHSSEYHPGVEPDANYEFLRFENGKDVYRDRRDGREVFVGRTTRP